MPSKSTASTFSATESPDATMADAEQHHHQPSHEPDPEFSICIRGLLGPPITDAQRTELDRWTRTILAAAASSVTIRPSGALLSMLAGHDVRAVVCPVVRHCVHRDDNDHHHSNNDGLEYTFTAAETSPPFLAPSALYLYYASLERILKNHSEASRDMLLLNRQFHRSLYSLCRFSIRKATSTTSATSSASSMDILEGTGSCSIVYYKLIESYVQELSNGDCSDTWKDVGPLPEYLILTLRQIQEMLLDSLWTIDDTTTADDDSDAQCDPVYHRGPTFIEMINKLRTSPSSWPLASLRELCLPIIQVSSAGSSPATTTSISTSTITAEISKESMFVGYIVQKLLISIERRLTLLCQQLSLPTSHNLSLSGAHDVKEKTLTLFTLLLCYRVDLFFGRHPDQVLLCSLYIVCSKMDLAPRVGFREIVEAYGRIKGECLSEWVVKDILYRVRGGGEGGSVGDIVSFYNTVFVPSMKGLWGAFLKSYSSEPSSSSSTKEPSNTMSDVMALGSSTTLVVDI